jgi:hypothetical protein
MRRMSTPDPSTLPEPFFHADSGTVRFWVASGEGAWVGASIAKETLHYRFRGELSGANAVATYTAHRTEIDDAVKRRIAQGSIEPVMLRESDVATPKP